MPVLRNPRHEKFAQALAKGKTATEAYVEAGYKGDRKAASNLWTKMDIRERVSAILVLFFVFWWQSGWYRLDCALGQQKACDLITQEYLRASEP